MDRFDITKFTKDSNYIIEASAGTGKTFSIKEMVGKLVLEQGVPLEKILIVTYTEKAAGELKDRIRDKLKEKYIGNVSIYTIHSFCQNAIKEFGISAGKPFGLEVVDEEEIAAFLSQYLRQNPMLEEISLYEKLGGENKVKEGDLFTKFLAGVKDYYLNSNGEEDPSIISLLKRTDEEDNQLWIDYYSSDGFLDFLSKHPEAESYFYSMKNSGNDKFEAFALDLEENGIFFNGNNHKSINKKEEYKYFATMRDKIKYFKVCDYLVEKHLPKIYQLWQEEKAKRKEQTFDDMIRTVRESVLNDDSPFLKKLKEKYSHAIIDEFQDTNQRQYDIFSRIFCTDKEHHIIVVGDAKQSIYSFQGADINVFENAVNAIAHNGGEQCILKKNYRSSKAMVYACNKLFPYFGFDKTTFEPSEAIDGDEHAEDKGKEHIAKFDGADVLPFWIVNPYEQEELSDRNFALRAARAIIDCCTLDENGKTRLQITRKGQDLTNVSFKDFTVLAKSRSEMPEIERVLKHLGIPCSRYKDQGLFHGKECAHWLALLQALNVPDFTGHNRETFKKALFTNFFGYTLEELTDSRFDKDDTEEALLFKKWKEISNDGRWEDLFDDIIISSRLSDKTSGLSNLQSLSIYKQIGDYCIDYLYAHHTIADLIRHITNLSIGGKDDDADANGALVEKRTDFDSVQIMTIHASKGLQFPVVISMGGLRKPATSSDCYKFHKDGKQYLTFDKDAGDYSDPSDPKGKKAGNHITDESDAEAKRLFYVAYTRAEYLMILPNYSKFGISFLEPVLHAFMAENQGQYLALDAFPMNTSYKDWKKEVSQILEKTKSVQPIDAPTQESQNAVLKDLMKEKKNQMTYMHSYSSLSHESISENRDESETADKEGFAAIGLSEFDPKGVLIPTAVDPSLSPLTIPHNFPRGTYVGTALHEIFELADFTSVKDTLPENFDSLIIHCFAKQGLKIKDKEDWMAYVRGIVLNVLNATFPSIKDDTSFQLNEIDWENRKSEMEFNFNLLGGRLKHYSNGFIDLLFRRGDVYYLLDWKSDRLNDDDLLSYSDDNEMKVHVDNCYSIQRVLYSYCLIEWLKQGYPDLSEEEIFNTHFGGIYYVFLRGCNKDSGNGIYAHSWKSWSDLKEAFDQVIKEKIGG